MGLSKIQKGVVKKPRRCMLYAVEGIGKSTFASLAPDPIFLPTEEGLNEIDCESFPLPKDLDEFFKNIATLIEEDHQYKTVVVDTLDWLERLIWDKVCEDHNKSSIEEIGYAKGYKFALTYWNRFLKGLEILRNDKGMMIILIAHCQIEKFEDPERAAYDRYGPRLHKHASALIREWSDEVLFACYEVDVLKEDAGFGQKRAKAKSQGKRIMRTTERASHMAKNRLSMPDELPFAWKSYAEYL